MLKFFKREDCPKCAHLKKELDRMDIKYTEFNIDTVRGLAEFCYYAKGSIDTPMLVKNGEVIDLKQLKTDNEWREAL